MKIIYGNIEGWNINGLNKIVVGQGKNEPFYVQNRENTPGTIKIVKGNDRALTIGVEYSSDMSNWISMGNTSTEGISVALPANGKLYFRAQTPGWSYMDTYGMQYNQFSFENTTVNIGGNIMSLLYGSNFTGNEVSFPTSAYSDRGFYGLFRDSLNVINAGNLILPATTLVGYCYGSMFNGCDLLTTSPVLPATILARYCYQLMFNGCSSLTEVKCFATDISANNCLMSWLNGVAASGTFYKDANTTYPEGTSGIPEGWTVVNL